MAVPHLSVEEAENMVVVDVVSDGVDGGPRGLLEEAVREGLEGGLVHLVDFVDVLLTNVAVEVDHEGPDGVGNVVRVVAQRVDLGLRLDVLMVVGGSHGCLDSVTEIRVSEFGTLIPDWERCGFGG